MTLSELGPIFDGGVALWKRKLEVSGTRDFIDWKPANRHDPREMRMALDLLVNLLDLESVEELVLLVESSKSFKEAALWVESLGGEIPAPFVNIPNAFWNDHMKRFAEFLRESRLDEELDKAPKEIYSIDLAKGRLLFEGMEDGSAPEFEVPEGADPFEAIADAAWEEAFGESIAEEEGDGKKDSGGVKPGWGGEEYVSLDFPSFVSERKEKEDSATLQDLDAQKRDADFYADNPDRRAEKDWTELAKKKLEKYSVVSTGGDPEWQLAFKGEPVTPEQAENVVKQKTTENKYATGTKIFRFDDDGVLLVGKIPSSGSDGDSEEPIDLDSLEYVPLGKKFQMKFLKELNDKVNSEGRHFRWIGDTGKLEINTTSWIDGLEPGDDRHGKLDDPRDRNRFDRAEYAPVVDPDKPEWTQEWVKKILSIVNAATEKKKSEKGKKNYWKSRNLEYRDGRFWLEGKPMGKDGLEKLAISLNGGFGGVTKLLNPQAWKDAGESETAPYWDSYKISIAGSKIGDAINFNLPPKVTCAAGVPCIKEGCYALKAYAAYPSAKAAMQCNLALLRKDKNFELFKKSMIRALETKKKDGSGKFTLCRIHVNGDLGIWTKDVDAGRKYLQAICDIAAHFKKNAVHFWMYTKQYEILEGFGGSIPPNLSIIVSCWGKFNPYQVSHEDFKNGKLESGLENIEDREEDALAEAENIVRKLMETDFRNYVPVSEARRQKTPEISRELAERMVAELAPPSDFNQLINLAWEWDKTKDEALKNINKIFSRAIKNVKKEIAFKAKDPRLEVLKTRIPAILDEWKAPELVDDKNFEVPNNYRSLAEKFPLAYLNDGSRMGNAINHQVQKQVGLNTKPKTCPCTDYTEIVTRCETCGLCWDGSLKGTNLVFNKH